MVICIDVALFFTTFSRLWKNQLWAASRSGSHKTKSWHATVATAQKVVLRDEISILASVVKQKLEGKTRRPEEAKSSSKSPCMKVLET